MSPEGYASNDCEDSANSSLGVAHAPGPFGPWTRSDRAILTAARPLNFEGDALANPAVVQWGKEGEILLGFRGRHDEILALASAPHWSGPYERPYADNPDLTPTDPIV